MTIASFGIPAGPIRDGAYAVLGAGVAFPPLGVYPAFANDGLYAPVVTSLNVDVPERP